MRKGQNRAARALRLAAQGCHRSHNAMERLFTDASRHVAAGPEPWSPPLTKSRRASIACSNMGEALQSARRWPTTKRITANKLIKGLARRANVNSGYRLEPKPATP